MYIQVFVTNTQASEYHAPYEISVTGTLLTLKKGTFRYAGVDYELLTDEDFDFDPLPANETYYAGFLVRRKSDDEVMLLVDEVEIGVDQDYVFDDASPYELLDGVFNVRLPGGLTDLADRTVRVRQLVGR